jgi:hypothetical protein
MSHTTERPWGRPASSDPGAAVGAAFAEPIRHYHLGGPPSRRKPNTPPGEVVRVGRVWAVRGNVAFVLAREGLPGPPRRPYAPVALPLRPPPPPRLQPHALAAVGLAPGYRFYGRRGSCPQPLAHDVAPLAQCTVSVTRSPKQAAGAAGPDVVWFAQLDQSEPLSSVQSS